MIKPSPFKIAQVMTIRLSHARDSSTVFPLFGKIHHQKGNRCRYDCSNGGNEDNLVIDILHDLIGFSPDGSGKNRLCVSAEDCDSQKCSIQASAIIDMPFCVRRAFFSLCFT